MLNYEYIVWHTAAHYNPRTQDVFDTSKDDLYQWHVIENGWTDIGYHFLVRFSGEVVECRPLSKIGAHCRGINNKSVGICFSGSGDNMPLTKQQLESGLSLTRRLQNKKAVPASCVIGHNEINTLIEEGKISNRFRTSKACPGAYVDMSKIRAKLSNQISVEEIISRIVEKYRLTGFTKGIVIPELIKELRANGKLST